jgi:hypothetical protein
MEDSQRISTFSALTGGKLEGRSPSNILSKTAGAARKAA